MAINGVCLTVTRKKTRSLDFDVMKETLECTTLKNLVKDSPVNLERALKMSDRLSGHLVTGHVDGIACVKKIIKSGQYVEFQLSAPKSLMKHIVPKGSVTLAGVSLTVGKVSAAHFSVYLIPFTLSVTTLGKVKAKDCLNLETDVLAKYVFNAMVKMS